MDFTFYLNEFQKAADKLDRKLLKNKQMEVTAGVVLNSVFLKLYKKAWSNKSQDPLTSTSRIFFSVWINDSAIQEQKIYYNIHAFKLRQLDGYTIKSRDFADKFRTGFKKFEKNWPNVSVKLGPLTLMEGWVKLDMKNFKDEIVKLANYFLEIEHLIDNTLKAFEK